MPSADSCGAAEDEANTRRHHVVRTHPIGQLTEVLLFGEDVWAGTTSKSLKEHRFSTTLAPTPARCPASPRTIWPNAQGRRHIDG